MRGGAQRPVTFLTHFLIPPSSSRAGREGTGAAESHPRAAIPRPPAAGVTHSWALQGTGRKRGGGRVPASPRTPPPPRLPLRGPSPVTWAPEHLLATSAPSGAPPAGPGNPLPPRIPTPSGKGWERCLVLAPPTPLRPGRARGAGGRPLPSGSALQSAKERWPSAAICRRGPCPPPPPAPPRGPLSRAERRGGVPPPPARLRWKPGLRAGAGRGCCESGPGRRGRGQVAGGDGWGVRSGPPSPGRGREAAVSAATSEPAKRLSNSECAAPLPRAAGRAGGCAAPWAPAPGPAGRRSGCGRAARGRPGLPEGPGRPGGKTEGHRRVPAHAPRHRPHWTPRGERGGG